MRRSDTPRARSGLTSSTRCNLSLAPGVRMALNFHISDCFLERRTIVCLASSSCCLIISTIARLMTHRWAAVLSPEPVLSRYQSAGTSFACLHGLPVVGVPWVSQPEWPLIRRLPCPNSTVCERDQQLIRSAEWISNPQTETEFTSPHRISRGGFLRLTIYNKTARSFRPRLSGSSNFFILWGGKHGGRPRNPHGRHNHLRNISWRCGLRTASVPLRRNCSAATISSWFQWTLVNFPKLNRTET